MPVVMRRGSEVYFATYHGHFAIHPCQEQCIPAPTGSSCGSGFTPQLLLAHLDVESCSIVCSHESQACVQAGGLPPAPGRCDGKSARMRISGLLGNAAAIASFGPPLEPLQPILDASLKRLAAKCFEHPAPPTWRESEVSAKLHATGGGVDSCAGGGLMVDGA